MNLTLLVTVVLSWGFSWYAIALQIGPVSAPVSIAYRFALASALLVGWLVMTGGWRRVPLAAHVPIAGLGLLLFCLNFLCFYLAIHSIASGVASVVFAMASLFSAFNMWLFYGARPNRNVVMGAVCGVLGIGLLFAEPLGGLRGGEVFAGIGLAVLGTYIFSLGNLVSIRAREVTDIPNATARGMAYGALFALLLALVSGHPIRMPDTLSYLVGLAYLAVFASVVAFLSYLRLIASIGAARASYATVLFPLVALSVSTVVEGYRWTLLSFIGVALSLAGAALVFMKKGEPTVTPRSDTTHARSGG